MILLHGGNRLFELIQWIHKIAYEQNGVIAVGILYCLPNFIFFLFFFFLVFSVLFVTSELLLFGISFL